MNRGIKDIFNIDSSSPLAIDKGFLGVVLGFFRARKNAQKALREKENKSHVSSPISIELTIPHLATPSKKVPIV